MGVILNMPIPQPKDNEKQNDYMGRCMHKIGDEKMPQKQKVAICLNTFKNPKKKAKADRDSIEIDFSDKIKEIKEKKAQELAQKEEALKVEEPKVEPVHNAVTAPAEPVVQAPVVEAPVAEAPKVEVPVVETKEEVKVEAPASEIKAEVDGKGEMIQTMMLQMQNQYKIFHWQTTSFSQHKSFDGIVESLIGNIDEFIETYMGKYGRVIASNTFNLTLGNYKDSDFNAITDAYINFLIGLSNELDASKDSDLLNIRDEILGSLNQLKYLLTLV